MVPNYLIVIKYLRWIVFAFTLTKDSFVCLMSINSFDVIGVIIISKLIASYGLFTLKPVYSRFTKYESRGFKIFSEFTTQDLNSKILPIFSCVKFIKGISNAVTCTTAFKMAGTMNFSNFFLSLANICVMFLLTGSNIVTTDTSYKIRSNYMGTGVIKHGRFGPYSPPWIVTKATEALRKAALCMLNEADNNSLLGLAIAAGKYITILILNGSIRERWR